MFERNEVDEQVTRLISDLYETEMCSSYATYDELCGVRLIGETNGDGVTVGKTLTLINYSEAIGGRTSVERFAE